MRQLRFDPDAVDQNFLVRCTVPAVVHQGEPQRVPYVGDTVLVDDGTGDPLPAEVVQRVGDTVTVAIRVPDGPLVAELGRVLRQAVQAATMRVSSGRTSRRRGGGQATPRMCRRAIE